MKTARTMTAVPVLAVLAFAACGSDDPVVQQEHARSAPAPRAAADAPRKLAANLKDADRLVGEGKEDFEARLRSLRGHPVVVNQWASWCDPCRFELPFFAEMVSKYSRQVGFLGLDMQDERGAAEDFMRELPAGFPSIFDPDASVTASIGGGQASPTTFYYDERGKQVFKKIGAYPSVELLEQDVRRYALG